MLPQDKRKHRLYWLKNDLYHIHFEAEEILRSPKAWLNYHIMDAAQKLICKKLGADDDYQLVLNVQKRRVHLIVRCKINLFNYFMMVLDTAYLLFVAMEGSWF